MNEDGDTGAGAPLAGRRRDSFAYEGVQHHDLDGTHAGGHHVLREGQGKDRCARSGGESRNARDNAGGPAARTSSTARAGSAPVPSGRGGFLRLVEAGRKREYSHHRRGPLGPPSKRRACVAVRRAGQRDNPHGKRDKRKPVAVLSARQAGDNGDGGRDDHDDRSLAGQDARSRKVNSQPAAARSPP